MSQLATWARILGVDPDDIGRSRQLQRPERLLAGINEALGDRRALLIFNDVRDVRDASHFRDLGFNCQRLLTTRYLAVAREVAASVNIIEVDPLVDDAALQMLTTLAPGVVDAMADDIHRLVEAIDGIPLALHIVGRHLDTAYLVGGVPAARELLNKIRSAHDLLTLQEHETDDVTLRAVLDVSTEDLSDDDCKALDYLTVFPPRPNDFSTAAALKVTGSHSSLKRLRSTGLLALTQPDPGRYSLHRVIAEHARQLRFDREAAYRSMVEYFMGHVTEPPTNPLVREKWLAALAYESDNLAEALRWTVEGKEALLGLQLMAKLWPFWYHRSEFRRGREVARLLLTHEPPANADTAYWILRSKLLNDDGNFAYNMAEFDAAEARHREALKIRERLDDVVLQAGSWNNLGLIERERGELDEAEKHLTDARDVNQSPSGNPLWLAMNLNNLGLLAEWRENFFVATALQEESIERFMSVGEPWGVAMASIDRGTSLLWAKDIVGGEDALRRVLKDR